MRTEDCGKIFKTHYYFDPESSESVKGLVLFHCHHNDCPDEYCIHGRVGRVFDRFKDAFSDEIYYRDFNKHPTLTYNDILTIGFKLFKEIIVLDCYTFYRMIVSCPRNNLVDLTQFIHVKKSYRFLWKSFEKCKVSPDDFEGNVGGRRIFYRNIHKNPKVKRIPTIDSHFVRELKNNIIETKDGKRVNFSLPDDVRFKVYDNSFKMIGINEALQNTQYKWFCEKIHGFDFSRL